jgi:hypothetical protein
MMNMEEKIGRSEVSQWSEEIKKFSEKPAIFSAGAGRREQATKMSAISA